VLNVKRYSHGASTAVFDGSLQHMGIVGVSGVPAPEVVDLVNGADPYNEQDYLINVLKCQIYRFTFALKNFFVLEEKRHRHVQVVRSAKYVFDGAP
jgi:hypothetical protein